ncbi:MAG: hypothetical protein KC766_12630 [Myxococcales bacterium]|nr:hypothetical protein [Myxococcales bacterium]
MRVSFKIDIRGAAPISEAELPADVTVLADRLRPDADGWLVIEAAGQPAIEIEDDLYFACENLCLRGGASLLLGESWGYGYFTKTGGLRLDVTGDAVTISGDFIETARCARQAFAKALLDCGLRYLRFERALNRGYFEALQATVTELSTAFHAAGLRPDAD